MNALISAILVVVGAVVVVRAIYRRIEAWADAMILSFGLLRAKEDEDDSPDDLPHRGNGPTILGRHSLRPPRQVIPAGSEERDTADELTCS